MKKIRKFRAGDMVVDTSDAEEAEFKAAGLAASNAEKKSSGFLGLGRLFQGNIDEKGSEAYNKYGAGYGRKLEAEKAAKSEGNSAAPTASKPAASASASKSDNSYADLEKKRSASPAKGSSTAAIVDKDMPEVRPIGAAARAAARAARSAAAARAAAEEAEAEELNRTRRSSRAEDKAAKSEGNPAAPAAPAAAKTSTETNSEDPYADDISLPIAERSQRLTQRILRRKNADKETEAKSANEPIKNLFGSKKGGAIQSYAKGGSVSASSRGDGIAQRGKTRGRMC